MGSVLFSKTNPITIWDYLPFLLVGREGFEPTFSTYQLQFSILSGWAGTRRLF